MSFSFNAAPVEGFKEANNCNSHRRTQKNNKEGKKNVKEILNLINKNPSENLNKNLESPTDNKDDEENGDLANFEPLSYSESNLNVKENDNVKIDMSNMESFQKINEDPKYDIKAYENSYLPYYNKMSTNMDNLSKNELIEKLNYIIHILEEEKSIKTGHVTEELILYCFLGVFIIFIVDSFARTQKYKR